MWVAWRLMIAELDVLDVLVPLAAALAVAVCTAAAAEAWHEGGAAAAAEMSVLGPLGLQTGPVDVLAACCSISLSQGWHSYYQRAVGRAGVMTVVLRPSTNDAG